MPLSQTKKVKAQFKKVMANKAMGLIWEKSIRKLYNERRAQKTALSTINNKQFFYFWLMRDWLSSVAPVAAGEFFQNFHEFFFGKRRPICFGKKKFAVDALPS